MYRTRTARKPKYTWLNSAKIVLLEESESQRESNMDTETIPSIKSPTNGTTRLGAFILPTTQVIIGKRLNKYLRSFQCSIRYFDFSLISVKATISSNTIKHPAAKQRYSIRENLPIR
jgi:hypothetical protein